MGQEYFETRLKRDPNETKVWKAIVDHLQSNYFNKTIETSLDLGCGYGDFSRHIQANKRIAIDLEDVSAYQSEKVEFKQCSVSDLRNQLNEQVDLVFSSNLLEHLSREAGHELFEDIKATLKPNGLLVLLQPNFRFCFRNYFDDYTHQTIYTDQGLSGMVESHGFQLKVVRPRYLPFSMRGNLLPKTYWLTRLYLELGSPILGAQMLVVASKA